MTNLHQNLINGEWVAGNSARANLNPFKLSDVIGDYTQGDATQVELAVQAAQAAFPSRSLSGHPGQVICARQDRQRDSGAP